MSRFRSSLLQASVVAFSVLLALAGAVQAADDTGGTARKLRVATELVEALGVPEQLDHLQRFMSDQLMAPEPDALSAQGLSLEGAGDLPPPLEPMSKDAVASFQKRFMARRPAVLREIALVYAERFSLEELDALVAFYRTTAGTKLMKLSPELIDRTTDIGMAHGQAALDEGN